MPTVADSIAQFIASKEIKHAFGIIGAGNLALFEAITRLAKTEIVCCHHEQAAVMSATYYGRISGRPGVALLTTGAGSSNGITGALAALMDSVALLIISGNENLRHLQNDMRVQGAQGYHTSRVARLVCKEAWRVEHGARHAMEMAYEEAQRGRPGPVWLDVPRDVLNASC